MRKVSENYKNRIIKQFFPYDFIPQDTILESIANTSHLIVFDNLGYDGNIYNKFAQLLGIQYGVFPYPPENGIESERYKKERHKISLHKAWLFEENQNEIIEEGLPFQVLGQSYPRVPILVDSNISQGDYDFLLDYYTHGYWPNIPLSENKNTFSGDLFSLLVQKLQWFIALAGAFSGFLIFITEDALSDHIDELHSWCTSEGFFSFKLHKRNNFISMYMMEGKIVNGYLPEGVKTESYIPLPPDWEDE